MLSRSMTMSRLASWAARPALYTAALRAFTTAPSTDPLELMRMSYMQKGLCDESGYRLPGVHWTMAIAFGTDDPMEVCNVVVVVEDFCLETTYLIIYLTTMPYTCSLLIYI